MRFKRTKTLAYLIITGVAWYASLDFFCNLNHENSKSAQIFLKNKNVLAENEEKTVIEEILDTEPKTPKIIKNQQYPPPNDGIINNLVNAVTSIKNLLFTRENKNFKLPPYDSSVLDEKWNKKKDPIVFLHIGKNGGTSFDSTVKPIVKSLGGRYIGDRHFDWTYVKSLEKPDSKPKVVLQRVR